MTKNMILGLILAFSASASSTSLREHCENTLAANLPHLLLADSLSTSESFPSGYHASKVPASPEELEKTLDHSVHEAIVLLGSRLVQPSTLVEILHRNADLQLRYFKDENEGNLARIDFTLRQQAHDLAVLETLAKERIKKGRLSFSPELLAELVLVCKKLSQLEPPIASIDLTEFLLETKELTEKFTGRERMLLLENLTIMRAALSSVRPNDRDLFAKIVKNFDEVNALSPMAPEIYQAQILNVVNGMLAPVAHLTDTQLEFLRVMGERLPRLRLSNEAIENDIKSSNMFFAAHRSEILRFDPKLYSLFAFATGRYRLNEKFKH